MLVTSRVKKRAVQRKTIFKPSVIYGLCILFFFGLIGLTNPIKDSAANWLRLKGFFLKAFIEDPNVYAKSIPYNLFSSIRSFEKLPVLAIDIKFKNWQKLAKKRQIALASGALLKGEKWEGNNGRGLVHRSPQSKELYQRLYMTIDFPEFYFKIFRG